MIILSDYIKDPYNVFSEKEAEEIYKAAGFIEVETGSSSYNERMDD